MQKFALPIDPFKDEIVTTVAHSSVVVIEGSTGSGKSTQVPQYLFEAGYDMVVTQPRVLAARSVAARVAEEMGVELGGVVGYRTARERSDSSATRILFATDGLALVRELMGQNRGILVIDEVHEWNENVEVLAAWAKQQIRSGAPFKLVLMSATLEAERLSQFFNNAPIISVPGNLFPVEERPAGRDVVDDAAALLKEGRNVLVFQPGKTEINETCQALQQLGVSAEILPLHGGLTPEEQAKCFQHYGRPKCVVATNVAQTSVTIDDIDAVVDSGMERRIELRDGVEGLYLGPISIADSTQRKGRAGRTKPGIYIDHCDTRYDERPEFPVAEIMRKRLDQTVLRLAIAGFDMEEMEFFHQPSVKDIHDAHRALIALGCMEENGAVTPIGKTVNRLPVSVQYARMLVEADRLGVIDDVLTVAAIMEVKGITIPPPSRKNPLRPDWREMVQNERESDVMAQLHVWKLAETMTKDQMRENGVSLRDYFRAKEIRSHLADAVKRYFSFGSSGDRVSILKAVCAGMVDHLFQGEYARVYRNGDGISRELGQSSVVFGAKWVVGLPFDLEIQARFGGKRTLRLIELASKVDPAWLAEVAPQLAEVKTGGTFVYDRVSDAVVEVQQTLFNGQVVGENRIACTDSDIVRNVLAKHLANPDSPYLLPYGLENEYAWMYVLRSNSSRLFDRDNGVTRDDIEAWYREKLVNVFSLSDVERVEALRLPAHRQTKPETNATPREENKPAPEKQPASLKELDLSQLFKGGGRVR
jgi:HrpA-like RNA helicase